MRSDFDEEQALQDAMPGCDENPMEFVGNEYYNPFHYCYEIPVQTDAGEARAFVRFFVYDTPTMEPVTFTAGGREYSIPFFEQLPEIGLAPIVRPETTHWSDYQIGENRYHVAPAVVKATIGDKDLSRDEASRLILPEALREAIIQYHDSVSRVDAPEPLLCLLGIFDNRCDAAYGDEGDEDEDGEWD